MHNLARPATGPVLELVQLTDSHLFSEPRGQLLGLETRSSLQQVLALLQCEHPRPDLLLATGDLSQDGSLASYQAFRQLCAPLGVPVRWCPGNHDDRLQMCAAASGTELMAPVTDLGAWRIILLDTRLPGAVHGQLADSQLELLARALDDAPERHGLIGLHHHPLPVGSDWMDSIGLHNSGALWQLLESYPQVRALLWGHVHQAFDRSQNGRRLLASPSTCIQFTPGSARFQTSMEAPGYRWLHLYEDGRLDTGISRVQGLPLLACAGGQGY